MAKLMMMEDDRTGFQFESYWIPVQVNLNRLDCTGMVCFSGFASKDARLAKRLPVATRVYAVSPTEFDQFFADSVLSGDSAALVKACYALAMSVKDVPAGDEFNSFFFTAMDDEA